jgi:PAS domain S-box-containing protein
MGKHQGEAVSGTLSGPKRVALLVLLIGLAIAALVSLQLDRSNRQERQARFQALSQRVANELKARIGLYETGLRGARGAVIAAGGESITHQRFREYSQSRDYEREFPGVRGYGYVRRVLPADESAFLETARRDGTPTFAIHQIEPHNGDRFVIRYIEPESSNREAIGLDIASEANRRTTAIQAARSGMPTLTEPITLLQNASKPRHSVLLLLPIYRIGSVTDTPEQRLQSTFGWSFAPISIDEVLRDIDLADSDYSLAIWDGDSTSSKAPFYFTRDYRQAPASGLTDQQPITAYGQQWELGIKARPSFVASLNQTSPTAVGGVAAAIALLVAALAHLLLLHRQRRHQASLDQARMAALVESSSDAILAEDTHGMVTHWNHAAERMFDYPPSDAVGRPLRELIAPPAEHADEHDLLAEILSGQKVPSFGTYRRRRRRVRRIDHQAPLQGTLAVGSRDGSVGRGSR